MSNLNTLAPSQSTTNAQQNAWYAVIGILVFSTILTLLDFIEPNFNPLVNYGSDHLNGPYRWVMTVAFISLGSGYWFLASSFSRAFSPPIRSGVSIFLIRTAAVGFILAGIFPGYDAVKPWEEFTRFEEISTLIHLISALISFLILIIAGNTFSNRLRKAGRLQGFARFLQWQAVLSTIFFLFMMYYGEGAMPGLVQRIFIYIFLFPWAIVAALGIRSGLLTAEK